MRKLSAFALLATAAAPAVAPTAQNAFECRLSYPQVLAVIKTLKVLSDDERPGLGYKEREMIFDPKGLSAFGIKATRASVRVRASERNGMPDPNKQAELMLQLRGAPLPGTTLRDRFGAFSLSSRIAAAGGWAKCEDGNVACQNGFKPAGSAYASSGSSPADAWVGVDCTYRFKPSEIAS